METTNERSDSQEKRIGPTVSKDKWVHHALGKMARGYCLIVGNERRTANFHMPGKGYEMCAYNVAKQLIKDGAIVKTGNHQLGSVYRLLMAPAVHEAPAPTRQVVEDEEAPVNADLDLLIDQIEREAPDGSSSTLL